jgi:hypothetical protein
VVSVFVIDCTTTGASDPTCTPSIHVLTVGRRCAWEGEEAKVSVSIYGNAERYAAAGAPASEFGLPLDHGFWRYYFRRRLKPGRPRVSDDGIGLYHPRNTVL